MIFSFAHFVCHDQLYAMFFQVTPTLCCTHLALVNNKSTFHLFWYANIQKQLIENYMDSIIQRNKLKHQINSTKSCLNVREARLTGFEALDSNVLNKYMFMSD